MQGTLTRLLFSFKGRIRRTAWWWASLLCALVFIVLYVLLENTAGTTATWILYPPLLWIMAALAVKRLHDRAESPLWLAILVIPILGPLWLFVKLALRRGTPGENQYGDDPVSGTVNYLVVK